MKFDYCTGNPPYMEMAKGTSSSDDPIYNVFMDAAYTVAEKAELITPARFLFNAGKTPKRWNEKMLNDEYFKVKYYESKSSNIFPSTDIKGGIAITYRDSKTKVGAIGAFVPFEELQSILRKVKAKTDSPISSIIYTQNKFDLDILFKDHPEYLNEKWTERKDKRLDKPIFSRVDEFKIEKPNYDCFKIIGINNLKREWRYINQKYIDKNHPNLFKWKVILPVSNGSGALGEVLSTPLIGEPLIGYTRSFIGIGAVDHEKEANFLLKYIKSKFARTMLGVLKITQDNTAEKWKYVPLQDFTSNSDINWSKSIHEIDLQLYAKYGLSDEEINFIETRVKEMD